MPKENYIAWVKGPWNATYSDRGGGDGQENILGKMHFLCLDGASPPASGVSWLEIGQTDNIEKVKFDVLVQHFSSFPSKLVAAVKRWLLLFEIYRYGAPMISGRALSSCA